MVAIYKKKMINAGSGLDVMAIEERLNLRREKMYGRGSSFKTKKSFAPSNLGYVGQCPRHWYYAFNGAVYNEKFNSRGNAALENGKDTHTRLQKEYQQEFGSEIEVPVRYNDPPIFGFADVEGEFPSVENGNVVAIGDCKSIKEESFWALAEKLKPDARHFLQVLIYMYIRNIEYGFVHYEAKSSHFELFFKFRMTDRNRAYVERTLEWMRIVHRNALEGELPARGFEKKSTQCSYCPLFNQCWKEDKDLDGELTIPNFVLEKP
jgi:CRISPR/Cas system-associated exonuclease Cas4 (RecB family)